jgi:hypothetical protein
MYVCLGRWAKIRSSIFAFEKRTAELPLYSSGRVVCSRGITRAVRALVIGIEFEDDKLTAIHFSTTIFPFSLRSCKNERDERKREPSTRGAAPNESAVSFSAFIGVYIQWLH